MLTALFSLSLIYFFSPQLSYKAVSAEELYSNCEGSVQATVLLQDVFISKNGNRIGIVSDSPRTFVLLNDIYATKGDRLLLKARASRFRKACWLFPEKVKWLD
ncbi:hypothetical protein DRN74_01700 [Candidatus Micrarchaeota archaeon]|nr:MAG: hypothetical protein DRN74_01700 [Candidatus Micrarchaeota archaeon]